jgi:NAD(P)-dependent dehydrogenase (short-subunit alcohol dehydrogenase family)
VSDRVVAVVGASSGIGLATAQRLARRGDRLMLAARDGDALERAEEACRAAGAREVSTVIMDVGVEADVHRLVAAVLDRHGRVDAGVHTATVMAYGTIEQMPPDVFTRVVDIAVHGTAHLARAVLPVFRRQGRGTFVIVNSLLGSVTVPQMGAYATAKWGQRAVARTLQQEVRAAKDIHVCIVSPGSTNTPIYYQAANYTGRAARPPIPVLQPERVATSITALLDKPRKHVSIPVGPANPIVITGYRLLPFLYDLLVGPLLRLAALRGKTVPGNAGNVRTPNPAEEQVRGRWPAE